MLLVWTSLLHSKIKAEFEPLFKAMSSFNPSPGFRGCAFSPHFLLSHLPHTANFILSCCCVVWPLAKRVWRLLLCKWDMSSSAEVKNTSFWDLSQASEQTASMFTNKTADVYGSLWIGKRRLRMLWIILLQRSEGRIWQRNWNYVNQIMEAYKSYIGNFLLSGKFLIPCYQSL